MSKVIDAPADPSTAASDVNEGFAEFQAAEREARNKSATAEEPSEAVPASEPVKPAGDEPAKPPQEPLTDEQKSAAKRANNEKRWDKLTRDLSAAQAEIERLKTPKAETAAPATAAPKVVHVDDPSDPRPKQEDFTDFDEYLDVRSTWNARQVIKADRAAQATAAAETQAKTKAGEFMGGIGKYAETHQGFLGTEEEPGSFEIVRDELENGLQQVSSAIVEHDQPAELIDYLGTHPEALAKILAHRQNPAKALIELGRIIASEFDTPPVVEISKPKRNLPPPPSPVTGRGHAPSGEAALDAAADANDFAAFQKALRGKERAAR